MRPEIQPNPAKEPSIMMKNKKPEPDESIAPKLRHCLSCRDQFTSAWAGERICPKCKSSSTWRSGSAH